MTLNPVVASMRRIPEEIPVSEIILKAPISPVLFTCVPPHSSLLDPILSTLTSSAYFSPKSIMAPLFLASSRCIVLASVSVLFSISWLTNISTDLISSEVKALGCEKSKRVFDSSTSEPFCST